MVQQPVRVYALEVPPGDMPIPAGFEDLPASVRISMAAIDPSAPAQLDLAPADQTASRATLKIIKVISDELSDSEDEDEDYDSDDIAALEARLRPALGGSDEDSEEDSEEDESDEEVNGGPSDPAKTKKARKAAAVKHILEALSADDDMEVDDIPNGVNGVKKNKGKGKASDEDDDEEIDSDDEDSEDGELEEFVICTLDTTQHYQQPIDITINENEQVYFKVIGTHSVFLTGNYIADIKDESDDDDYEDDDDDEMDLMGMGEDSDDYDEESDELDDIADPRITEVESDVEEAPKLVKAAKKGKNKRPAEDSEVDDSTLDDLIAKSMKPGEAVPGEKLSKKQLKKLKNNEGQAVAGTQESATKEANGAASSLKTEKKEVNGTNVTPQSAKSDKKVQFAKNLEQGPTGSPLPRAGDKDAAKPKQALGEKIVRGVKLDDKKLGKGPAAKKGDKVGMRYIGKLEKDGKVFDSNKKGKPFSFNLGKGEVIEGWDIGVEGMTVGAERRLTIPAKLAYGKKALPGIPANSNLVFDVKLISIN